MNHDFTNVYDDKIGVMIKNGVLGKFSRLLHKYENII